jgi:hypothetical protein
MIGNQKVCPMSGSQNLKGFRSRMRLDGFLTKGLHHIDRGRRN